MSAKNKGAKSAKTKQRAEKAKQSAATKLIPELAAMKPSPKLVAKLEALSEPDQETVLNYVNSGIRIEDACKCVMGGKLGPVEPARRRRHWVQRADNGDHDAHGRRR